MCDVCQVEKIDWRFRTADRPVETCRLYRVYEGREAVVRLCRIHAIELFMIGETRFLETHPLLALSLTIVQRALQMIHSLPSVKLFC